MRKTNERFENKKTRFHKPKKETERERVSKWKIIFYSYPIKKQKPNNEIVIQEILNSSQSN